MRIIAIMFIILLPYSVMGQNSIERMLPGGFIPGEKIQVVIDAVGAPGSITIIETPPTSWEISEVNLNGRVTDGVITWDIAISPRPKLLEYILLAPITATGMVQFLGDAGGQEIGGESALSPWSNQEVINLGVNKETGLEEIRINIGLSESAKPFDMVRIPEGTFFVGSPSDESGRSSSEDFLHEVTIRHSFFIGKYEVTQAQWDQIMGSNPASNYGVGENYPVYNVTWFDSKDFIDALNKIGLGTFRLPSEAEWEYACRADTFTRFYWGDDPTNTEIEDYAWRNITDGAKEVGLKFPNDWGLHDMSGNVWEWCEDDWHDDYIGSPEDESAWIDNPRSLSRVYRGGSWYRYSRDCRSAKRAASVANQTENGLGLRLVRTIEESALNDWTIY